jgi:hypothetical protein
MPTVNRGDPFSGQALALAQELRLERDGLEVGDYYVSPKTDRVELIRGESPTARSGAVWVPRLDQVVVRVVGALKVHTPQMSPSGQNRPCVSGSRCLEVCSRRTHRLTR